MRFYIPIGHGEITSSGRPDPGAVSGQFVEHQMNAVYGLALAERLAYHGHTVKVEQGNLSIGDNARAANAFMADYIIDCHMNAGGGDRGEVIYAWKNGSIELANAVAAGLKKAGQTEVRVYKSKANSTNTAEYFGTLRLSKMPGVIIEPCFLDNALDRQIADTEAELKNIGYCIADAIAAVYGRKEVSQVEPWKADLMNQAKATGLITSDHNPDDPATKWFVLAIALNLLKAIKGVK